MERYAGNQQAQRRQSKPYAIAGDCYAQRDAGDAVIFGGRACDELVEVCYTRAAPPQ